MEWNLTEERAQKAMDGRSASLSPARAYWNQRRTLAELKERILLFSRAADDPVSLSIYQFAQLMATTLEFGPDLIVEIRDTGIGISPETMPRIFNAFEQGERSRTRVFGGLGLGLAISRAVVEAHGGTIWIEDNPQGGAMFFVLLPKTMADSEALSQAS